MIMQMVEEMIASTYGEMEIARYNEIKNGAVYAFVSSGSGPGDGGDQHGERGDGGGDGGGRSQSRWDGCDKYCMLHGLDSHGDYECRDRFKPSRNQHPGYRQRLRQQQQPQEHHGQPRAQQQQPR